MSKAASSRADSNRTAVCRSRPHDVVEFRRFVPHTEFATFDVPSDAFARGSDASQFVIVNWPCPVQSHVRDQPTLHQVDQMPLHSRPNDVSSHEQEHRCPALPSFDKPMAKRRHVLHGPGCQIRRRVIQG